MQPENARSNNIELHVEEDKLAMPEFKALWSRINAKSVYVVDFDTNELIKKSIAALNSKLHVSKIYFQVVSGTMNQITAYSVRKSFVENADIFTAEKCFTATAKSIERSCGIVTIGMMVTKNVHLPAFLNQILRNIIWKPWKNYCPTRIHTLQNVRIVSKMKMY